MGFQIIATARVSREEFLMVDFLGTDDIFALVKEGSFVVKSNGVGYTVKANEGFLFKKEVLYHRSVVETVTMYLFRYKSDESAFQYEHVIFNDKNRLVTTFNMLETLDQSVQREDFEYRNHLFFDLVMQHRLENAHTPHVDEPIESAITKIISTIHQSIDLSIIANESGLSYVQFLRRFKNFCGLTPSEYINELRVQKAKKLLTDTNMLVKDIAYSCGFENEYYFSNFFKKHTAMSPTAFRSLSS